MRRKWKFHANDIIFRPVFDLYLYSKLFHIHLTSVFRNYTIDMS